MKKLLIVLCFLFALPASASTISDGAIVKTNASPDIYIVKYSGGKMYKRLVLNPLVFNSYGHLKWENLLTVSQEEIDSYITSELVRVDGSLDVYELEPNGDNGEKYLLTSTQGCDTSSIYTINLTDFNNYVSRGTKGVQVEQFTPITVETSQSEANEMMKADIIKDLEAKQQAELAAALEKQKLELEAQLKAEKEEEAQAIAQALQTRANEMSNVKSSVTSIISESNTRLTELSSKMKVNRDEYNVTSKYGDRYFELNRIYTDLEREYNPLVEKRDKLVAVLENVNNYINSNTPVPTSDKIFLNSLGISI